MKRLALFTILSMVTLTFYSQNFKKLRCTFIRTAEVNENGDETWTEFSAVEDGMVFFDWEKKRFTLHANSESKYNYDVIETVPPIETSNGTFYKYWCLDDKGIKTMVYFGRQLNWEEDQLIFTISYKNQTIELQGRILD